MSSESPNATVGWGATVGWIAVGAVLVVAVGLAVLMGGPVANLRVAEPDFRGWSLFGLRYDWEYGWPLAFLRRVDRTDWGTPPVVETWGTAEFSCVALAIDLIVGGLLVAGGLAVVRWWRNSRQHWLQIYLSEILILTTLVAGVAGWLTWNRRVHAEELRLALQLVELPDGSNTVLFEKGGPWWLRDAVGPAWLSDLDRAEVAHILPPELPKLVPLRSIRFVRMVLAISPTELQILEQLPRLEALECQLTIDETRLHPGASPSRWMMKYDGSDPVLLPYLPRLRLLELYGAPLHPDCAERLPNVEAIDFYDKGYFPAKHDASVEALVRMPRLRLLRFQESSLSADSLARLRRELPECAIEIKY